MNGRGGAVLLAGAGRMGSALLRGWIASKPGYRIVVVEPNPSGVVKDWAKETCGGRLISCMEGGYNLETLGETVRQHVRELQSTN